MGKSLRDQLRERKLVSEFKADVADELERRRLNHECYKHASHAAKRVDSDHKRVIVEYRHHRSLAK